MMTPEIKQEIDKVLVIQSGDTIDERIALLAGKIKSISTIHFGQSQDDGVMDLFQAREQAAPFVAQSYKKVAKRYKQIAIL